MWRILLCVGFVGCINQASKVVNPPPEGGGTLTCAQIAEQCDAQCTNPMCLHGCSNQGTLEAAQQHDAVLSCGEQNSCMDETCLRTNCSAEMDTCQGPPPPEEPAAVPPPEPTTTE
jgi:hypothetical protein